MGPSALGLISKSLRSKQFSLRLAATEGLTQLGPEAAPKLVSALTAGEAEIRLTAARGLRQLGSSAIDPLIQSINRSTASELLPVLVDLDPYWHQRRPTNAGYDDVITCWELMQLLIQDGENSDLIQTLESINDLDGYAVAALPLVTGFATHEDQEVREAATKLLTRFNRDWIRSFEDSDQVETMAERLRQPDPDLRLATCELLGKLGPDALPALPRLIDLVGDENESPEVLSKAIWAIGQMGKQASGALPVVCSRSNHDDADVRIQIAETLCRFRDEMGLTTLRGLFNDEERRVRDASLRAIQLSDTHLRTVLSDELNQMNGDSSSLAVELLRDEERFGEADIPMLLAGLSSIDEKTRDRITRALHHADSEWQTRPETMRLFERYHVNLANASESERQGILQALEIVGPNPVAIKLLIDIHLSSVGATQRLTGNLIVDWSRNDEWHDEALEYAPDALRYYLKTIGSKEHNQALVLLSSLSIDAKRSFAQPYWFRDRQLASRGTDQLETILGVVSDPTAPARTRQWLVEFVCAMGPELLEKVPVIFEWLEKDKVATQSRVTRSGVVSPSASKRNESEGPRVGVKILVALAWPNKRAGESLAPEEWPTKQQEMTRRIFERCISLLGHRNPDISSTASETLMTQSSNYFIPLWTKTLEEEGPNAQRIAIYKLTQESDAWNESPAAGQVKRLLFATLANRDSPLCSDAGFALTRAGITEVDLPLLRSALQSNPLNARVWQLVAQLGPHAAPAITDIVAANGFIMEWSRSDEKERSVNVHPMVRPAQISETIRAIGVSVHEPLTQLAKDSDPETQASAADLINRLSGKK